MLNNGTFSIGSDIVSKVTTFQKRSDKIKAYDLLYIEIQSMWQGYMENYINSHKHSYAIDGNKVLEASQPITNINYGQFLLQTQSEIEEIETDHGISFTIDPSLVTILSSVVFDPENAYFDIQNEFLYVLNSNIFNGSKNITKFLNTYHELTKEAAYGRHNAI